MLKEGDPLDTAAPLVHVRRSKEARSEIPKLFHVVKALCCVYDTAFSQLTDTTERKIRDCLFGNVYLVVTDLSSNVRSKIGKGHSKFHIFP